MSDTRELLRRGVEGFEPMPDAFERVLARRDRKRRNQRIAAGVVGIAAFVAAVWIVTSGLPFDRSEMPAATGPAETGPAETGPAETAPPLAHASPEPNVTKAHCSDGARSRLELTKDFGEPSTLLDDRRKARFEVHDSPPGHLWHIRMWRSISMGGDRVEIWRGARVASDSGDFAVVQVRLPGHLTGFGVRVKAIDSATGEVCDVYADWAH